MRSKKEANMTRVLLAILICVSLVSCATSRKLSTLPRLEDLTNTCDVYIIRKSTIFGSGLGYTVAMDYQDFVVLANGDYTKVKVASGPHVVTVKYPRQMFLGTAESPIEFDCKESNNIYIYMWPGLSVNLEILAEKEGAELVQKSNYIDLNR
jgi:hypothetical protein